MIRLAVLAFRNLGRRRRRTVLTAAGIAAGVALFVWMDGMLRWAERESERNLVRYESGEFVLSSEAYAAERRLMPLEGLMDGGMVVEVLGYADRWGLGAMPRTAFRGSLVFRRGFGLPYVVYAVDPLRCRRVFDLPGDVVEGAWLEPSSRGIVLSRSAARELGVGVGDEVVFQTRTPSGAYQALALRVEGIFEAKNPVVNRHQAFVAEGMARETLGLRGAAEVVFRTPDGRVEPWRSRVREFVASRGSVAVVSWDELAADYVALSRTKRGGTKVMLLLVFLITAVGVANTMLMSVYERVPETAMMRALGMRDGEVAAVFLMEAGVLGLTGSVAGVVLGGLLNLWGAVRGLDFSGMFPDVDIGYRTVLVFRSEADVGTMSAALVVGVMCAVLVGVWPAWKAATMEVTEGLREGRG